MGVSAHALRAPASFLGGYFNNGSNDGLFNLNRNNAWGNANSNIGVRLSIFANNQS